MHNLTMPKMLDTERLADHWYLLPAVMPVPELGILSVNSMILSGSEPLLVDTGLAALRDDYISQLSKVIDPALIKWIWLSHLDADHLGNLDKVLEIAPDAKVLTSFLGLGKLMLQQFDVTRVQVIKPGETLIIGGRTLKVVQPPYYDAPETLGFFDTTAQILFCADCFGATFDRIYTNIGHIPSDDIQAGLSDWLDIDTPWLKNISWGWLSTRLDGVLALGARLLISSHLPGATADIGKLVSTLENVYWNGTGQSSKNDAARNLETVKKFFHGTHHPDLSNLAVIEQTVSEEVTTHGFPAVMEPIDHQSYRQFFIAFRQSFGNMQYTVNHFIADGNLVSCHFEIDVKHIGEFAGIPATDRKVSFTGMVMYRLENNLIQETWLQIDMLAILNQITGMAEQVDIQ